MRGFLVLLRAFRVEVVCGRMLGRNAEIHQWLETGLEETQKNA